VLKERSAELEGAMVTERNTFTIRVRPDLMKSIKMLSVEKETTISNLFEEAIQDFLKKNGIDVKKQAKK
jgi:predicted transcriptional regulator